MAERGGFGGRLYIPPPPPPFLSRDASPLAGRRLSLRGHERERRVALRLILSKLQMEKNSLYCSFLINRMKPCLFLVRILVHVSSRLRPPEEVE